MEYQISNNPLEVVAFISNGTLLYLLFFSSYTDLMYQKIYNKVTVPCLLLGIVLSVFHNPPLGFWNATFASILAFGLFSIMFILGFIGGGDVKFVAAIGALTGYPLIIKVIFWGIVTGGIYALIFLIITGKWKDLFRHRYIFATQQSSAKIPYGICISIGTFVALMLN